MPSVYTDEYFKGAYRSILGVLEVFQTTGYTLPDNILLVSTSRNNKTMGRTVRDNNSVLIEINLQAHIADGQVDDKEVFNTILHELCHSFVECDGHGHRGEWRNVANKVEKLFGVSIKATA